MVVVFVTWTIFGSAVPSPSNPTAPEGVCMPRMKKPRMRANSGFACGALKCVPYSEATYLPVT